ncbi:Holliday junction resolvase RuvX [Pedobacter sp. SD-b]|uniref:Putative pre-16S rRNA nuclease n=1 Tax=Pedobacter segetis TaxID=2793069 RepID=A0ABS1BH59_9SPHI|nr:Holliday junction resolvase RuvX [Pedobacter segetis]MBK0382199.1 Holliday junction resolvase RuvX [Pedobacter segetis]
MPRIMCFDYGNKRTGIAVTDPLQLFATGLTTIHPKDTVDFIKKYLLSEQVESFVVGQPFQTDGTPSETAQNVKGFVTILKKSFPEIPIYLMDERFTSKMANAAIAQSGLKKSARQNKDLVDTVAAVIILQSYLERKSLNN